MAGQISRVGGKPPPLHPYVRTYALSRRPSEMQLNGVWATGVLLHARCAVGCVSLSFETAKEHFVARGLQSSRAPFVVAAS